MRDIKFRFWNKRVKSFVYPQFAVNLSDTMFCKMEHDQEIVIQQFTGIKDKNKKEIYEGDILEYPNGNRTTVFYDPYSCQFVPLGNEDWRKDGVVIGNIFENPKLLK